MPHFPPEEFAARRNRLLDGMEARGLDAMLLFAPESQYWLTGFDTFGYCFFQCLVVAGDRTALLVRSADLRQAQLTSNVTDIRVWKDAAGKDPAEDLLALLKDMGLEGRRLGWEIDTHGLTALNGGRVARALEGWAELADASSLVSGLRLVKSPAEMFQVRKAAALADAAWEAAAPLIRPGAAEGEILAALQGEIFRRGGDYPGNETVIGAGANALLCRYQTDRRRLGAQDQLTLEWAGVKARYHAALMRTVVIGTPGAAHLRLYDAAREALEACEAALRPGNAMSEVFAAHARTLDARGMAAHRLNACGYALGARFSPSWMEREMFFENAPTVMAPDMVFFLHMILMDSESGAAMTLGRTSVVTERGAEPLSRLSLDLPVAEG